MKILDVIRMFNYGATKGIASHLYIKGNKLINYDTVIAYRDNEGRIFLNVKKYTASTSKIQELCKKVFDNMYEYEGEDFIKLEAGVPKIKASEVY